MVQNMATFPNPGSIIEFMQENEPHIAWVLEVNSGKLRLLLPNRRETTIPLSRVLPWSGPCYSPTVTKDSVISTLQKHKQRRSELLERYNPIEIWEFVQSEVRYASAIWLCELITKDPDSDNIAACAYTLLKHKTHFKFQPPNFEIYSKEIVEKRLIDQERSVKSEQLIQQGKIFLKHLWDVHTKKALLDKHQLESIEPIKLELKKYLLDEILQQQTESDALWKALIKELPDDLYLAYHLAQAWGIIDPHYNFYLERINYEMDSSWSLVYQNTINELSQKSLDKSNVQCSPLKYISIDAETTKDIDDAFYIQKHPNGGWKVSVALACPALNWSFESPLDHAVRKRATSIYLPEKTYHMLPDTLGTNVYSLYANIFRPALIVTCIVNEDGQLQEYYISFDYVFLNANLTYDDCEIMLETDSIQSYTEQIILAFQLAQARQKHRLKKNAVIIERDEPKITLSYLKNDIKVLLEEEKKTPKSHLLISELMILTNSAIAEWAFQHEVPLLHRTQDIIIPNEYGGIWNEPYTIAKAMKVLVPSILEVDAKPHRGLGEQKYAPSTSPLRRYPDMINEAQILHYIQNGQVLWIKQDLQKILPYINTRIEQASQAQRYRVRYWKLVYMLQQGKDKWWPCIIVDIDDIFVNVFLYKENITLRAKRILFEEAIHLGQKIHVCMKTIRPLYNESFITEVKI